MNEKGSIPEADVPPPAITPRELSDKLRRIEDVLNAGRYRGIVIKSEGAMRWLTGLKHQLGDISPSAISPVNALVVVRGNGQYGIKIAAKPYEIPRLDDEIPKIFNAVSGLECKIVESMPETDPGIMTPEHSGYAETIDRIVRPLVGGFSGNQYKKLDWLSNMSMKVLAETARQLKPDMDGLSVRGLLSLNLLKHGIDSNLVLVALKGQEKHLHPIASSAYRVERDSWMKLVVGARYSEHIVSQSIMVKIGKPPTKSENTLYMALQDAAVEYADCYRSGASESEIYSEMTARFQNVEDIYGLKGFSASALLHHPGGGTSPLGNRDRMLSPTGGRIFEPWTSFAINPVDSIEGFKVEMQGVVQPDDKPPSILDIAKFANELVGFRKVRSSGGTVAELPDLLTIG
ncbi:MAG: M24 family metallopeptidase [Victivallales bacterium]